MRVSCIEVYNEELHDLLGSTCVAVPIHSAVECLMLALVQQASARSMKMLNVDSLSLVLLFVQHLIFCLLCNRVLLLQHAPIDDSLLLHRRFPL